MRTDHREDHSGGTLVAGTTVHLHPSLTGRQCAPSALSAVTNADGAFSFKGRKALEFLVVIGNRLNRWALCIEADGQFIDGWRTIGVGYPPERISFTCDLQAASQRAQGGNGVCCPRAA